MIQLRLLGSAELRMDGGADPAAILAHPKRWRCSPTSRRDALSAFTSATRWWRCSGPSSIRSTHVLRCAKRSIGSGNQSENM